jgi:endoglucanase
MNMSFKNLMMASLFSLGMFPAGYAANVTNQITGVGPTHAEVRPYVCIQDGNGQVTYVLKPGETVDANKYADNLYYVGATLRFGGCGESNSYLGYLGLSVNAEHSNKVSAYTPPQGVHIAYVDPAIDADGVLTGAIHYTAIQPNFQFLSAAPSSNADWIFTGINLSGLEFGKVIEPVVIPNLSQEDATGKQSDLAETQAFIKAGMNTVRVPISWGYMQLEGPGKGDLNKDYYDSYLKPLLETLTSAHVYAMVDLHAYMRYSQFGKEYSGCGAEGKCPDGTLVLDAKAYQDIWTKLYAQMKSDPKINLDYILLDLVNEPVDVPNDDVFTIQAEVIKSLRQQGYQGYILVEGNSWSGLHSWTTTTWKSTDGKQVYSNATLFTRENFVKAGVTDLSKILINAHQYLDSDYSGTHNTCLTDLTSQGDNGFNLNAFADYLQKSHLKAIVTEFSGGTDSASCSVAMTKFLNYLKDNAAKNKDYGFVGWTIWSTGHGWGGYNLRVTPTSYHMQVLKNYLQAMS